MCRATTASHSPRGAWCAGMARVGLVARRALVALWVACVLPLVPCARAQGVDLSALELRASEGALTLEFSARLTLSRAIEDALRRGVPMYFELDATLYRSRWYWRDERVSHVARSYRLSYQPLTGSWRVGLGALGQSYPTLSDALAVISRVSGSPRPASSTPASATTSSSATGSTPRSCRSRCRSGSATTGRSAPRASSRS